MLYKGKYLLNKNYQYQIHRLQSLEGFYLYLNLDNYRYQTSTYTLSYQIGTEHNPDNITKLLKHLRRKFVINGVKVPLHHIWKLEHRPIQEKTSKAIGFHYHLALFWNKDITPYDTQITSYLTKYWESLGGITNKNSYYGSHDVVKVGKGKNGSYPLPNPIRRTQAESELGIFHHLSYFIKTDPKQNLPDDYVGESFQTSQRLLSRLTAHPDIKVHNLSLVVEIEPEEETPLPIDYFDGELPF